MFIAATHLPPAGSIIMAFAIAGWVVWYWIRLGRPDVPRSRRTIRRLSLAVMLMSLPIFVRALSFLDPQVQRQQYVLTWSVAFVMALIVMFIAAIDVFNTLRLMRRHASEEMHAAAKELGAAIQQQKQAPARRAMPRPRHTKNGEAKS